MSKQQPSRQGHYSVIQYIPDWGRMETVNVGVVLFVPDENACGVKVIQEGQEYARVERFFGTAAEDYVKSFVSSFANKVTKNSSTLEELKDFIDRQANSLKMTELRSMALRCPLAKAVEQLFQDLVLEKGEQ